MSRSNYRTFILLLSGVLGVAVLMPAYSEENHHLTTIQLPDETARFAPGHGVEAAENSCTKCHSADYIYMQPPLTREQWLATVTKMKKAFGAPIEEGEVDSLVTYLMTQNGKNQ